MAAAARNQSGDQRDVHLSKKLAYVLRHNAARLGFQIDSGGFIDVSDLLAHQMFKGFTIDDIKHIVTTSDKQRFSLRDQSTTGCLQIRANQGHSFELPDLDLTPITNAASYPTVVHGTYIKFWEAIQREGLKRMKRMHVHFAQGELGQDGVISGMGRSCQIMIFLNLQMAIEDGLKFFLSKNGVILSPGDVNGTIYPRYFSKVLRVRPRETIPFTQPSAGNLNSGWATSTSR